MELEPTFERYMELGDRHTAAGEYPLAERCYTRALKLRLHDHCANLKLGDLYLARAVAGERRMFRPAEECLRRALEADPLCEAAHDKLILAAHRTGRLDGLAREYGEKSRGGRAPEVYAKYLKQIGVVSAMSADITAPASAYKPAPFIRPFFDLVLLPCSNVAILAGLIDHKYKVFFGLGVTMFMFYAAYRLLLYLMLRKR